MLVVSSFPYIAVGKYYEGFGYNSRLGIFYCIIIPFILVSIILYLQILFTFKSNSLLYIMVACFCAFGVVESNRNYIRLSGYYAKQISISNKIRNFLIKNNGISVVHLREYYQFPKTTHWVPAAVWTYMVAKGPNLPEVLVVDTRNFLPDAITISETGMAQKSFPVLNFTEKDIEHFCWLSSIPETLKNIPRKGNTVNIAALESGMGVNGEALGLVYIIKRLFDPSSVGEFLNRITKVLVLDHGRVLEIN
jgi:hypothetical protein